MIRIFRILSIALFSVLTLAAAAHAQYEPLQPATNETQEDQSEAFFASCMAAPIISVSEETDLAFCACAAAQMQSKIDQILQSEDSDLSFGRTASNIELSTQELMIYVYGPCIYIPEYDLTYYRCINNRKTNYFLNEAAYAHGMCSCLAEEESTYFQKYAQPYLEKLNEEGTEITDPIGQIMTDTNYYDAHATAEKYCFNRWSQKMDKAKPRR